MPRAIRSYCPVFGWDFTPIKNMPVEYWAIKTGGSDQPGIDGGLIRRRAAIDGVGVIAYVCTIAVSDLDQYLMKVNTSGGQLAVPRMAIPGVGWLAYCKDTEGNIFGMMQAGAGAK